MRNKSLRLIVVGATGLLLLMVGGCHSTSVTVRDEPGYRREAPPPRRAAGPPPWAPAHGHRAKHQYRYYPSSHVYYDTGRSLYFYYAGGKWQASVTLPSSIRIDLNEWVTLEMETNEPYRHHSEVVKRHPPGLKKRPPKGKRK